MKGKIVAAETMHISLFEIRVQMLEDGCKGRREPQSEAARGVRPETLRIGHSMTRQVRSAWPARRAGASCRGRHLERQAPAVPPGRRAPRDERGEGAAAAQQRSGQRAVADGKMLALVRVEGI